MEPQMADTPLPLHRGDTPHPGVESTEVVDPDRRAYRRARFDRPVMIETEAESKPGKALNVSGGGIALETELGIDIGSEVSLYFELPIGYAVETRAAVVRRDAGLVGLRFLELPRESLVALRSFARISGLHRIGVLPPK
jgi:hypothetical protein